MQPILFLMFEGKAEEALNFYVSLIPNIRMIRIERYAASGPGAEGSVMRELFSIGGMNIMCTDSAIHHQFTFASAAFVVAVQSGVSRLLRYVQPWLLSFQHFARFKHGAFIVHIFQPFI